MVLCGRGIHFKVRLLLYRSLRAYRSKKEISLADFDIKFDCRLRAVSKEYALVSCICTPMYWFTLLVCSWSMYHESASFRTQSAIIIDHSSLTVRRRELIR